MSPSAGGISIGVVAGLLAALFSALSYLVSRHHVVTHPELRGADGSRRLIVQAHLAMGLFAVVPSLLLWPEEGGASPRDFLPPALLCAAVYLVGQGCFFASLRRVPASRLSPLLGLKVAMLAAIVTVVVGTPLDTSQWASVALSVAAALALQRGDDRIPTPALLLVLVACLCFAVADLAIVELIGVLRAAGTPPPGVLRAGCLAMSITYVACGALLVPAAPWMLPSTARGWSPALQYGAVWLLAMIALYACLGQVGAVFGNILQSTRGVMSVALGALLGRLGWHELEERVDRGTFLRRIAAAMLMTAAIALWFLDAA